MRLPFGTDAEKYQWQRLNGRVFCMDETGQIVFVIDEPKTWRDAMLGAFQAGQLSEVDRHANYVELLETLCEEMLPDAFRPLDTEGLDILVKARQMDMTREEIQQLWDSVQAEKAVEWQEERKRIQAAVEKSWEECETTD